MILTIVIPCYNHGQYIQEAIDSVLTYKEQPVEIIIVDDGSTELLTINKINSLKKSGYHVIQHQNSGLAFSRNAGIKVAKGKYILPLDADNKIKADYIRKAIELLDTDKCDIIYGNPIFFGADIESRKYEVVNFDGIKLFYYNYIDACAIFKKAVWSAVGGFDEKMPYNGNEDWEFWIHAFLKKFRFRHLNEKLYYYRILPNSMIANTQEVDNGNLNYEYIVKKHGIKIINELNKEYSYSIMYKKDQERLFRSTVKYFYLTLKSMFKK